MRAYRAAGFAVIAFTLAACPVAAQEANTAEVTPYVALGSYGTSPVGVTVTFPVASKLSVETDVAYRREGRLNFLSSDVSLLWFLPRIGQATPYAAAGVGLAQYGAPVFSLDGRPIGTQSTLAMRVNAGGGLKMPINEKVGLRSDARWFKVLGENGPEHVRLAQGLSIDVGKR